MPGTVLDEVNIEMNKIFFPCSLWSYDFIKEKKPKFKHCGEECTGDYNTHKTSTQFHYW